MKKIHADESSLNLVKNYLAEIKELAYIKVSKRGSLLTLYSQIGDDKLPRARLRRETINYWQLEMPSHSRWEITPFRGLLVDVLQILINNFGWTLSEI